MNSLRSFKFGIYSLLCVVAFIIHAILKGTMHVRIKYLDIIILASFFVLVIAGVIYTIQGLKEETTIKKIIGIIINGAFGLLLLAALFANAMDFGNILGRN